MATKTTFQLDTSAAGQIILQRMVSGVVTQSAAAVLARANRIGAAISSEQPGFELSTRVGTIKRGTRIIATITANETHDPHQAYVAHQALLKAKDAGRVN